MGASVPIVVTSRSDSDKNKLNSIALAALIAQNNTI
jgi:phosphotransacetylase